MNFFKFTDFKKTQKVRLSACAKMYTVSGLLTNAHTCLYGNTTSTYFELSPPSLSLLYCDDLFMYFIVVCNLVFVCSFKSEHIKLEISLKV